MFLWDVCVFLGCILFKVKEMENLQINIPGPTVEIFYTLKSIEDKLNQSKFERYKLYTSEWQKWHDRHAGRFQLNKIK